MKVVLDSNVFVSALIVTAGKPAQILRRLGAFDLLTTEEILAETERVLNYNRISRRYGLSSQDIAAYIQRLREASRVLRATLRVEVIKEDPDDDKFLALAQEAGADYIVSGDPHLTCLSAYEGIPILTPARFLEVLKSN